MSLRLLHTADWQLGKPFHNLPAEVAPLLREARFAAVRTIAELATRHEVAAVLVAGDVFDSNLVPERAIVQALAAMRGFAGPWVLLPGNHDAALAEGVWSRLERLGRPANLVVAATPAPIALADGRLVVLPAPLTERHTSDDLTAWMDDAATPSGAVRVGLAHGSVVGRLPEAADAANPIDPERADRARLTIWRWATGMARSRSRPAPGTPARPSPTASAPTRPATRFWSSWASRRRLPWSRACRPHATAGPPASLSRASPPRARRMRLRRIEIAQFRKLTGPVVLDGLGDGLIVVSGDNEEGKSTVLAALKAAFFEHHAAGGAVREAMAPHRGGVPEITVEFECAGQRFRLRKAFRRAGVVLETPGQRLQDDAAERRLQELLRFERRQTPQAAAGECRSAGPVLGRPGDRVPRLRQHRGWP